MEELLQNTETLKVFLENFEVQVMGIITLVSGFLLKVGLLGKKPGDPDVKKDGEPPNDSPVDPEGPSRLDLLDDRVGKLEDVFSLTAEKLEKILEKVDSMDKKIDEFTEDKRLRKEHEEYVAEIEKIGEVYVTQLNLTPPLNNMITAGCAEIARLFGDILLSGLDSFNVGILREKTLNIMRTVRALFFTSYSQPSTEKNNPFLLATKELAHTKLGELVVHLEVMFSSYTAGHKTRSEWKEVYVKETKKFVTSFISGAITLHNTNKITRQYDHN